MINDGQHRRAAIEKALSENPDLAKDTVAVVFFKDKGLKKSQQMFSDLNRHAIRPSTSIAKLYDHRDPMAEIIRRVVYETEVFKGVVEMERSTITERSSKLFPFSGIYSASKNLIDLEKNKKIDQQVNTVSLFWETIGENMDQWRGVRVGNLSAAEVRRDFIHTHVIILQALGHMGKDLLKQFPTNWKSKLKNLGRMKIFKNDVLVLEIDSQGMLKKKEFYNKDDMENIKIVEATTESGFKRNSFIYEFMSSMRQKINDPLGQRAKKRKEISQR